jgi:hypothetical protein
MLWLLKILCTLKVSFMHHYLILKRIGEAAATIRQQLDILACTRPSAASVSASVLARLCNEVGAQMREHLVSVGNKLQLFFRIL